MVIHENQVNLRAWRYLTEWRLGKEILCQRGVVIDGHLGHIRADHAARVAMSDFLDQIGGFPLFPYGVGETVIANSEPDPGAEHRFDGCDTHAVVHVRARLVRYPGLVLVRRSIRS
ncbi:MAG: hypothetical protein WC832_01750 [Anaerolineales bacterium]